MKQIEKVFAANTNHRLTVSTTRVTMKLMEKTPLEECQRVEAFFLEVAKELEDVEYTLRGRLSEFGPMDMRNNKGVSIKTFRYEC